MSLRVLLIGLCSIALLGATDQDLTGDFDDGRQLEISQPKEFHGGKCGYRALLDYEPDKSSRFTIGFLVWPRNLTVGDSILEAQVVTSIPDLKAVGVVTQDSRRLDEAATADPNIEYCTPQQRGGGPASKAGLGY